MTNQENKDQSQDVFQEKQQERRNGNQEKEQKRGDIPERKEKREESPVYEEAGQERNTETGEGSDKGQNPNKEVEFPDGTPDKKENEKKLSAALRKGDLKIVLLGKKLKGEFALVKMKSKSDNSWLLIKKRDEYALSKDITTENKSVLSKKTIEDLRKQSKRP